MPKILKNFKVTKEGKFELLNYDVVFADMNICEVEMDKEYLDLYIFEGVAFERQEFFSKNKEYKLIINQDGSVEENENGNVTCILPIGIDLSNFMVNERRQLVRKPAQDEKKK